MPTVEQAIKFNCVWIVESLRPDDPDTVSELEASLNASLPPGFPVVRRRVAERGDLEGLLTEVASASAQGARPILHFELHGSEEGIELSPSGDFLTWEELRPALTAINTATRGQLFITMAVCWGGHMLGLTDPTRPSAFCFLLGPATEVWSRVTLREMTAFYTTLVQQRDVNEAMEAMYAVQGEPDCAMGLFSSKSFFLEVWGREERASWDPEATEASVTRVTEDVARRGSVRSGDLLRVRMEARDALTTGNEARFRESRGIFFSADARPDRDWDKEGLGWPDVLEAALNPLAPKSPEA